MSRGYDPDRLRSGLHTVRLERVFRVIHRSHRATPLAAVPARSRFGDPRMRYAVLYASETVRCAFWETLGHNGSCGGGSARCRGRKQRLGWSYPSAPRVHCLLVDLRGDGPVRVGASTAVTHDGNHSAGRALSAAVHGGVPEADGFLFASRFTGDLCVAVFDRAFGGLRAGGIGELVRHVEFLDALDEYDIVLTEPSG